MGKLKFINKIEILAALVSSLLILSCNGSAKPGEQHTDATKNVSALMDSVQKQVSREGPSAWLRFFQDSPDFFMVSGGKIEFPTYDSGQHFIRNTLVKIIDSIQLRWSNVHIDSLSPEICFAGADFREHLHFRNGRKMTVQGYFTAVAESTALGWKIHNAHWSMLP